MNLYSKYFKLKIERYKVSWRRYKGIYIIMIGLIFVSIGFSLYTIQPTKLTATANDFIPEESLEESRSHRSKYNSEKSYDSIHKEDNVEDNASLGKLIFSTSRAQRPYPLISPFIELSQSKVSEQQHNSMNSLDLPNASKDKQNIINNQAARVNYSQDKEHLHHHELDNRRGQSWNLSEPESLSTREISIAVTGIIQGENKQVVLRINNSSVVLGEGESYQNIRITTITNESVCVSVSGVERWIGI